MINRKKWKENEKMAVPKISQLSGYAKTKQGFVFDSDEDSWSISDTVKRFTFDFTKITCSKLFLNSFKKVIVFYLEGSSANHAHNLFSKTKMLVNHSGETINVLTSADFINYKASLKSSSQGVLSSIAGCLRKWQQLEYEGLSPDLNELLKDIRLKSNPKGEAVRTMDPVNGPLSEFEFQALHKALNDAHESKEISLRDYCLTRLFLIIGMRPIQYAGMKLSDLSVSEGEGGNDIYLLRIPRAKQRTLARTQFLERIITEKFAKELFKYIAEVEAQFPGFSRPSELPMFPDRTKIVRDDWIAGFQWHSTANQIGQELAEIVECLDVMSERTNEPLQVTSRRLRRTLGTRTAQEGHGVLIVAEVLDHTDIQNAGIYVEATPEIIERIDKAIAFKMAPMAQAFKGILITEESMAKRGNDPTSRIYAPKQTGGFKPAGNCGTMTMCSLLAPIACYTCVNFQPWLDGPHEKVLESLLAERDRLTESSGKRIAAIEDQTILAVAHVVNLCKNRLGGDKNE